MIQWCVDPTRAVLVLRGADARPFLQGLMTNDIARLAPGIPVYAALLSPQGKYLFDAILVDDGDAILADLARDRAVAFAQRLALYRLRRAVEITVAPLAVALLWGEGTPPEVALRDPRDPALGWRLHVADPAASCAGLIQATLADYTARRVAAGVPEAGLDLIPDDTFILEAGFERLHGVDFRKGCYVGQEVTARMKHKTELRRGLVRVTLDAPVPPGTEILSGDRAAGRLGSVAGTQGLAVLRLDRTQDLRAGSVALRLS